MPTLSHAINSTTLPLQNIITTPSVRRQVTANKHQLSRRRRPTTTAFTAIAITPLFSIQTENISSSPLSISSFQQQQNLFDDSYSAKTGVKTAALLGGMLLLVILYLIWKARSRLCNSSSSGVGNSRLSTTKFDLDYWLKQVDLLEAKEAERNRGGQSLYLELPNVEARDSREATALWIVDAYRHWRLLQYRQQQEMLRKNTSPETEINPVPYRRRRHYFRRLMRRLFTSSRHNPSIFLEHSPSFMTVMRPSLGSNNFLSPLITPNIQLRRTQSWPRVKSNRHQIGAPMSALQTHLARKRLLKRTSRPTLDI